MSELDWKLTYFISTSPFLKSKQILIIISCRPLHNNKYTPIFRNVSQYYFNLLQSPCSKLIDLQNLKSDDITGIIQNTLNVKVVPDYIKVMVTQYTGGNPLYINRWLKTLKNENWITIIKNEKGESISFFKIYFKIL